MYGKDSKSNRPIAADGTPLEIERKYLIEYPFWDDKATVEVELGSVDELVTFPPEIKVIKEVTEDRSYTSFCLAQTIE